MAQNKSLCGTCGQPHDGLTGYNHNFVARGDSVPSNVISLEGARELVGSGSIDGKRLPLIEFMEAQQAEIERLNAHIQFLQRDNANLKAQQAQSDAQAMHHLVRPSDAAWWRWLMSDADRCASVVADAYKGWDTDESWELTLKREIDSHYFGPEKDAQP